MFGIEDGCVDMVVLNAHVQIVVLLRRLCDREEELDACMYRLGNNKELVIIKHKYLLKCTIIVYDYLVTTHTPRQNYWYIFS